MYQGLVGAILGRIRGEFWSCGKLQFATVGEATVRDIRLL